MQTYASICFDKPPSRGERYHTDKGAAIIPHSADHTYHLFPNKYHN